MRVALVCADRGVPLGGPKGCSIHVREVARSMLLQEHDVAACVASLGEERDVTVLRRIGLDVHVIEPEESAAGIKRTLAVLGPDLVLERLALGASHGAEACRALEIPHVYEVNAPLDQEASEYRGLRDPDRAREAFQQAFAQSNGAVAVSDEVAAWVRSLAPLAYPVRVVPNGVGSQFYEPIDPASSARARSALGPRGGVRIVFAGSFRPWHDLHTLLQAVALLRTPRPVQVVLLGDGPMREEIAAEARRVGVWTTFPGVVPHHDVPAYLRASDIAAVTYAREDAYFSPLKLAEAMACGLAVVASATGPCARAISHERNGLLVPPGDVAALAGELQRLVCDGRLRGDLGAEARRGVLERGTWDHAVSEILRFGQSFASRRAAR